ncbi:MAG TPA: HlyD family efflux transporter periplasmic adaptor subunit [Leptolyngbyaceae cyanobacterium]
MTQLASKPEQEQFAPPPETPEPKRKRNPRLLLIPIGVLIVGAGLTWYFLSRPKTEGLQLSGRIEGYPTDIGARVPGRVNFVAVREGDTVSQGQVIVRLDDAEIQAQLRGATARIAAAQQQERQVQMQIEVVNTQIQEAELNRQQSEGDARGRIYQAQANVAGSQAQVTQAEAQVNQAEAQVNQAQAQVNQARSQLKLATTNRDRYARLVREGAISQQQFDQFQTTFETAQATLANAYAGLATARATLETRIAAVDAARRQVNAAQGALVQVQTTSINPDIRKAQVNALRRQLNVIGAQLDAAKAEVANAQAAQQQILAQINYLSVISPMNGVVITRSVEPGQVVTSGKTLLTIIDPNSVYMRGYVPEGQIGQVRIGQKAKVILDSAPTQPLAARVAAIDTQASFTPENIYFKEDRVKQVFGVKLTLDNPQGFAKPGMPADGEILTNEQERQK